MRKDNYLKFSIKERLDQMKSKDSSAAKKNLPDLLGISRQTFSTILNCREDSYYNPSPITLMQLASFFDCNVDELYNNPPSKVEMKDVHIVHETKTASQLNLTA